MGFLAIPRWGKTRKSGREHPIVAKIFTLTPLTLLSHERRGGKKNKEFSPLPKVGEGLGVRGGGECKNGTLPKGQVQSPADKKTLAVGIAGASNKVHRRGVKKKAPADLAVAQGESRWAI